MTFRRIYWITEEFDAQGHSTATGIYTSVADLEEKGLRRIGADKGAGFRLSLVKLDSSGDVLGRWTAPGFEGLLDAIPAYVQSGEMSESDRETMAGIIATLSHI